MYGLKIELDTDMNGDGETTGCWISKGDFSASLEALDATGNMEDSNGNPCTVPASTVAKIRRWAEANGY